MIKTELLKLHRAELSDLRVGLQYYMLTESRYGDHNCHTVRDRATNDSDYSYKEYKRLIKKLVKTGWRNVHGIVYMWIY